MIIGIDASRAFLRRRTGIEEYSYQIIRHLRNVLQNETVVLYVRKKFIFQSGQLRCIIPSIDFELPPHWQVKGLWAPRFWTQMRLSLEMLLHPPTVLFIPAHTVPLIHPERTVVTIHGLEYEFSPESYHFLERLYMRWSIRYSVRVARRVIAVSENTKRDLVRLYGVPETKMTVVYEGVSNDHLESRIQSLGSSPQFKFQDSKYFLFIGRLETRKNIVRMIEAFERFKQKMGLPHILILAGKRGYGYEDIRIKILDSQFKNEIYEVGYITEEEKFSLLKNADIFLFPSLYEGFGLPVLEAQQAGVPIITADTSSLPEIAGEGAILVDPLSTEALAAAMEALVQNPEKRADIIEKATRNADRFDWAQCAREVAQLLLSPKNSSPS